MEGELLKVQSKLENKQESSVVLERSKSTIVHKIFKANSSFHVKWRTRGGGRGGGGGGGGEQHYKQHQFIINNHASLYSAIKRSQNIMNMIVDNWLVYTFPAHLFLTGRQNASIN